MTLTPEQEHEIGASWEKIGATQVRSDLDHGRLSPALFNLATRWLSEKERESERRREAFNSEQIEIARTASLAAERAATAAELAAAAAERQAVAAERANTRATIALIIAMISIVATIIMAAIGIWITHNDARKTEWPERQNQSQS